MKIQSINNYKSYQWSTPIRLLFRGYGLTFWKWSGVLLPLTSLHFGKMRFIGYDIFHNGIGLFICFPKYFVLRLCFFGKIHWSMKYGIFQLIFLGKYKLEL